MKPKNPSGPSRDNHFLPKHYLRGFTERNGSPFIWVYERGKTYVPGNQKRKHNPCRQSIKTAGMERDFYACQNPDGTIDFETYEMQLKERENSDSLLLQKIRAGKILDEQEKLAFSKYMFLMHKRVPARQTNVKKSWPNWVNQELSDSPMLQGLDEWEANINPADKQTLARIDGMRHEYHAIMDEYKQTMPDKIRLDSILEDLGVVTPVLSAMKWSVLIAPTGTGFVAGDNPIFFTNGIKYENSMVIFPISTNAVLITSWLGQWSMRYGDASRADVEKVNRAIASIASDKVYYAHSTRWLVDMLAAQN